MPNIGWDETSPADTESLSQGDDRIRSLKTSLRQGLAGEHTWPSGGGDAGVHLLGSARAYVGTQSQVSSSGTEGRLMFASDTSRFFHVGSGGTVLLGGPRVITRGNYADPGGMPQRHYWAEEMGLAYIPSGLTLVAVTIPNSGFSAAPLVFVSQQQPDTSSLDGSFAVAAVTPTSFTIFGLGSSGYTFAWRSIGSRCL